MAGIGCQPGLHWQGVWSCTGIMSGGTPVCVKEAEFGPLLRVRQIQHCLGLSRHMQVIILELPDFQSSLNCSWVPSRWSIGFCLFFMLPLLSIIYIYLFQGELHLQVPKGSVMDFTALPYCYQALAIFSLLWKHCKDRSVAAWDVPGVSFSTYVISFDAYSLLSVSKVQDFGALGNWTFFFGSILIRPWHFILRLSRPTSSPWPTLCHKHAHTPS